MNPDHTVKRRDIETLPWSAGVDLTGTVSHRLLIRPLGDPTTSFQPTSRITDMVAGIVEQDYGGELEVGIYEVELKTVREDGKELTYPNGHNGTRRFARLEVIMDIP